MRKRIAKITANKAHRIMGIAGRETIDKFQSNCNGIDIDYNIPCSRTMECDTCACTKAHEIISRRESVEFPAPEGPIFYRMNQEIIQYEQSYNGHKHAASSQCDTTRYAFLNTHRSKSGACQISIGHIPRAENLFNMQVGLIKKDGEAVFNSNKWVEFIAGEGITREISAPDTSEQNGKAEAAGKWMVIIS